MQSNNNSHQIKTTQMHWGYMTNTKHKHMFLYLEIKLIDTA